MESLGISSSDILVVRERQLKDQGCSCTPCLIITSQQLLKTEAFTRLEEQVSCVLVMSSSLFKLWHKNWVWRNLNSHSGEKEWDNQHELEKPRFSSDTKNLITNWALIADKQPRVPSTKGCSSILAWIAQNNCTCAARELLLYIKHKSRKVSELITVHAEVQKERSSYLILLSLKEKAERPQPECLLGLKSCKQPEHFAVVGRAVENGRVSLGNSKHRGVSAQAKKLIIARSSISTTNFGSSQLSADIFQSKRVCS